MNLLGNSCKLNPFTRALNVHSKYNLHLHFHRKKFHAIQVFRYTDYKYELAADIIFSFMKQSFCIFYNQLAFARNIKTQVAF